jgi:hypothetical protein
LEVAVASTQQLPERAGPVTVPERPFVAVRVTVPSDAVLNEA